MSRILHIVRSHAPKARTVGVVIGVTLLAEVSTFSPSNVSARNDAIETSQSPAVHGEQHVTTSSNTPADSSVTTEQSVSNDSQSSSSVAPSTDSSVFINGQEVTVPPSGEVHQTVTDDNGTQTHIDVSMHSSSSTQTSGSSHTHISTSTHTQNQSSTTITGP